MPHNSSPISNSIPSNEVPFSSCPRFLIRQHDCRLWTSLLETTVSSPKVSKRPTSASRFAPDGDLEHKDIPLSSKNECDCSHASDGAMEVHTPWRGSVSSYHVSSKAWCRLAAIPAKHQFGLRFIFPSCQSLERANHELKFGSDATAEPIDTCIPWTRIVSYGVLAVVLSRASAWLHQCGVKILSLLPLYILHTNSLGACTSSSVSHRSFECSGQ